MDKDEKFRQTFGGTIRKALNKCPLAPAEAQRELDKLKETDERQYSEDEIEVAIDKVLSGDLDPEESEPDLSWMSGVDTGAVGESVYALNRNLGDEDAEVDAELDELRKKALDEEESDDGEDVPGVEGRTKPPPKSG